MNYFQLLQLEREPFSNSPDPDYFFRSDQHQACLQKLELALRLKRGLNVILGDVGTGKTTMCRELIRQFAQDTTFETHLILDPATATACEFLQTIAGMICDDELARHLSESEIKERIKQTLFKKGVDQGKTIILIIDEGQKIASANVETLRELLNYETNEYKLLQIVVFAQQEFAHTLENHPNFADRVNLLHQLSPMNFSDTCRMIHHRLKLSSSSAKPLNLFTKPALWAIYQASRGYPRRIIHICHQSMLAMIIQNKSRAGWRTIRSCKKRLAASSGQGSGSLKWVLAALAGAIIAGIILLTPRQVYKNGQQQITQVFKISRESAPAPPVAPLPEDTLTSQATVPAAVTTIEPAGTFTRLPETSPGQEPRPQSGSTVSDKPENSPAAPPLPAMQNHEAVPKPSIRSRAKTDLRIEHPAPTPDSPPGAGIETPADENNTGKPAPPVSLGSLTVRPGDTIGGMVHRVYGAYRNQIMGAVLEANPQILRPNKIEPGDEISFPALPFPIDREIRDNHWIILGKARDLARARNKARHLGRTLKIPTRLISWWSPKNGLQFRIAVKATFGTLEKAEQFVETLPAETAANASIVSQWEEGIQLFSEL